MSAGLPADGQPAEELVAEGLALSDGRETTVGHLLGVELHSAAGDAGEREPRARANPIWVSRVVGRTAHERDGAKMARKARGCHNRQHPTAALGVLGESNLT